ncbi:MAG: hypothetical protein RL173_1735 [Fibrobacterota bacterium]|jgi:hypothetical protein
MSIVRAAALVGLLALAFNGCSNYKQVNDPSDGDNGKTKNRPTSLSR